jgi:mRNA interferase MazF
LVIARGDVRWASLGEPAGSGPGYRRPVVVVSADSFNASTINTVIVVAISSDLALEQAPGNVFLPVGRSALSKDSVANVSQILTIDRRQLGDTVGSLDVETMNQIESGLRRVLQLDGS